MLRKYEKCYIIKVVWGDNMAILFLLLNVILFALSFVAIFLIVIFLVMKKYNFVGYIVNTLFIAMLVVIMLMSWNIVFMNLTYGLHPFEVNYYISGNYDIAIIFFVFYFIFFIGLHLFLNFKLMKKDVNIFSTMFRYLLPVVLIVCYSISTIIFLFSFNYFEYLKQMF